MKLYLTDHAVRRYVERWKPQLGEAQARQELEALVALAERSLPAKPHWVVSTKDTDAWIELAPNCVAAVQGRHVTTVFARSGHSKEHRAEKREAKRRRRSQKRWRNRLREPGARRRGKEFEWA